MTKNKFKCVEFDDNNKKISILIGNKCSIDYADIKKVSILNQQATFKNEKKPFTHQIMYGTAVLCAIMEPQFYVGLKFELKDGSVKAAFISDIKTIFNTDIYREDNKEANKIKKMIDKRINEAVTNS